MKRKLQRAADRGPVAALAPPWARGGPSERKPENAATTAQDDGLLPRLGDAAKGLVDGGSRPAKPEVVSAGLAVQEKAAPAKVWPPQRRVRELTGKRTENSRVYQLSDGRTQAEISAVPLHYQDAKGRYQPIDTTVRPTNDKGYVQGNRTNSFTSLFGDSTDDLVRFERGGRSIELGCSGRPRVSPRGCPARRYLPRPGRRGGHRLRGHGVGAQGEDRPAPGAGRAGSYTFTLETAGLTAQQREDGSIAFVRPTCVEPVFVMPAPFMYDDKDDKSSPHGKVWSDKVTQKVTQSGGTSTITVSAMRGSPTRRASTRWLSTRPSRSSLFRPTDRTWRSTRATRPRTTTTRTS